MMVARHFSSRVSTATPRWCRCCWPSRASDVNQAENNGATPLFIASQEGHVDVVRQLLLREDADVNLAENNGATPLYIASQEGHVDVVRQLLAASADVNQASNSGATPLGIARLSGHGEVVKLLLDAVAIASYRR